MKCIDLCQLWWLCRRWLTASPSHHGDAQLSFHCTFHSLFFLGCWQAILYRKDKVKMSELISFITIDSICSSLVVINLFHIVIYTQRKENYTLFKVWRSKNVMSNAVIPLQSGKLSSPDLWHIKLTDKWKGSIDQFHLWNYFPVYIAPLYN